MKRVLASGMLIMLAAAVTAPVGAGVATAAQVSTSPTPFACTKDANGKCNQLLIDTPKCVAIGLPIAPFSSGDKSVCQTQIDGPNGGKITVDGVSNDAATGGAVINYLRGWLRLLNGAVALVVMLMLVIAGIQYMTSLANPSSVAAAKKRIVNSMIALVMWLMMFAVLQFLVPGGIL